MSSNDLTSFFGFEHVVHVGNVVKVLNDLAELWMQFVHQVELALQLLEHRNFAGDGADLTLDVRHTLGSSCHFG